MCFASDQAGSVVSRTVVPPPAPTTPTSARLGGREGTRSHGTTPVSTE